MPDGLPDAPAEMLEGIADAIDGPAPETAETINPAPAEATATPEGSTEAEAATEAPDSFTKLDPNSIPEELQPWYKSMQSDYTRKQQEAAPWRKLGEELGVDSPDAIREAAELYAYLQDPNNLREFHAQLGQAFGQAPQPATVETPAEPQFGLEDTSLEDPAVAALRSEFDQFKQYVAQREQVQQQEALQWQLLGELNRQEAMLKEQHPDWGDEEWSALWNTSVATNGDLVQAASLVEAAQNAAVTRLLNSKAQAASTEGLTPIAPGRVATQVSETPDYSEDPELKGPTAEALDYLRHLSNLSE